ncbi:MAG: uracil-DNA glycosylase [Spirochaetaceae bacterium]|jgi:DNA polymerase|nr:uracil-DNA glycosylase [Spirochaetaceae bacterium]
MTGAEKNIFAEFLDTAAAALSGGYYSQRVVYNFADDRPDVPDVPRAALTNDTLDSIAAEIRACTRCPLHRERKNAAPGEGIVQPLVLVIGEGPGADEDASGRPFVGKAGQLLDKMLTSIGLSREKNCFIANIVKCRPPGNRDPEPEERAACIPFLQRQLAILKPLVILSAGRISATTLLETGEGISRLRGIWKHYQGIPLLPTFHPSYLLRDESKKTLAWEDMKSLCRRIAELDSGYEAETAALRSARHI